MKILCVILARGGSKGIPGKNIKDLAGKPLLSYTIEEARKSKFINNIIVSTDDKDIRNVAVKYGAIALKRPAELSTDTAKPVECIQHATKWAEFEYDVTYDYVVELLCTNPFKTVEDIDGALQLQIDTNADSVIGVMPLEDHHPIRIKKIVDGKIQNFNSTLIEVPESRRQDLKPDAYIRCGSVYSMRRDMLEQGIRYGTEDSRAYIIPRERVVNIDEPMDFVIADILMKRKKGLISE